MSRSGALNRARNLREELLATGFERVSIELGVGRPGTPHDRWWDDRFIGCLGHHTVSRRSQGLTPVLALVKRGRIDVPGPLANAYMGYDLVPRILCMGWANHPGLGGPLTLPGGTIPTNNGRPYLFGWEHEGGILLSDWNHADGAMREAMGACHAATLTWLRRDERSHHEHKTWARPVGRKIDRLDYDLGEARAELRPYLRGATITDRQEGEMLEHGMNIGTYPVPGWVANEIGELQQDLNRLVWTATTHGILQADGELVVVAKAPSWYPLKPDEKYGDATADGVAWGKGLLGYRGSGARLAEGFRARLATVAWANPPAARAEVRNDSQHRRLKALEDAKPTPLEPIEAGPPIDVSVHLGETTADAVATAVAERVREAEEVAPDA